MKVFEPFKLGNLELKNRMVVSAMVTNYCSPDGRATEKFIAYHEHKARGGWGLIITEDYAVTPTAGGFVRLPGLWEDGQIESHRELTERVHRAGGKIAAQIYHAGRETSSAVTGVQPVAPSPVKEPSMPETPRELTVEEIHELVEQFGDCARRAREAGFDAVEVHGAHGYLVGAFASPFSNKRSDEYGGTIRNRARFAMEIIRNIKKKCGEDYPVLYRMSAVEYVPGGLEIEESKVIAVGRINDVEIAESVLESGKADLVTMARASLADPDMPNKVKEGRADEVIRYIGCLQGCAGENGKGNCVRCLVNPLTGMEDEYDLSPVQSPKQVLVIGGGVSGCEAAIAAAMKGHKVTLIEKTGRLGGQWIPASVPIGKSEFTSFIYWQKKMLEKLHVQVLLNTEADQERIRLYEPDTLILATGSRPFIPPVKGTDQDFVTNAHDILLGKREAGDNVVVVGGGLVGAETADMLGGQCSQVSIIEMLPQIMKDGEPSPAKYMKERFRANGVKIYTSTKLTEVGDHCVIAEREGESFTIENVDTVIIAVGVRSDRSLLDHVEDLSCKIMKVGDANGVKNGYLGIREGFEAGMNA